MEQLTNQRADRGVVKQRPVTWPAELNGDFALGLRTLPRPVERPDFARGQETASLVNEGPDFARGQRTRPLTGEGPDYARGMRQTGK